MALNHPNINPDFLTIGPIHATWYGLMYVCGFLLGYYLALVRQKNNPLWEKSEIGDLLTYLMLGVILGGRIGYVLFYGLDFWKQDIFYPLKIYDGGMSFHGGLLGVVIASYIYGKRHHKTILQVGDFIAPLVPVGLFFGRIGNFINGELWGRATDLPWGMIFQRAPDNLPRHPSMLYEAILEGIVLFIVLWIYSRKRHRDGQIMGLFLLGYGICRFLVEFVREPDPQLGYLAFNWLTMGQVLCFPMMIIGMWLLLRKGKRHETIS